MTDEHFELLVNDALQNIPEKFRKLMNNVAITTEGMARPEQNNEARITKNNVLLGLYQGVPLTHRGPNYGFVLPDKITIFKDTIMAIGKTEEGIKQLIKDTVWHEIAHHFGSDEYRVREAENKRKKNVVN